MLFYFWLWLLFFFVGVVVFLPHLEEQLFFEGMIYL